MPLLKVPPRPILTANSTSTQTFNPLTEALDSTHFSEVRVALHVQALSDSNVEMKPGVQYSNDGLTWDSAIALDLATAPSDWSSGAGWKYMDSWKTLPPSGTQRLFCRFGVIARNSSVGSSRPQNAQVKMYISYRNTGGQTLLGAAMVNSSGSTSNYAWHPMTDPVPVGNIASWRVSFEMSENSGASSLVAGYQVCDSVDSWDSDATLTGQSDITTNTVAYGTTFTSASFGAKQFVRFGIRCKNASGAKTEMANATLRVDLRQV